MIPLILAWSVNTHKLQGTTLVQSLSIWQIRYFQKGLLYVAMSRCRTLSGLQSLISMRPSFSQHHTIHLASKGAMQEMERLREALERPLKTGNKKHSVGKLFLW